MSKAMVTVFVRPNDVDVTGSVVQKSGQYNVVSVQTESTDLNLHFDSMEHLDEFVRRISAAAQQVWDELHPDDQKVPIVGGIDLS